MHNRLSSLLLAWRGKSKKDRETPSDVLGSYTGTPTDPNDPPEQDADDL